VATKATPPIEAKVSNDIPKMPLPVTTLSNPCVKTSVIGKRFKTKETLPFTLSLTELFEIL